VELVNDAAARLLPSGLADASAPLASSMPDGPLRRALEAVAAARRDGRSTSVEAEAEVRGASGPRSVRASVQDLPGSGGLIAVLRDVTEERELARAKVRLFDNLTHDLRSPMTAILGFARMLRTGESGPVGDEQTECLDRILEQGERLLSLVDAQLDIVRLEGGAGRVDKTEVDVEGILSEVIGGFAAAAQARGIALAREPAAEGREVPKILGDARLVYRLFANLVGNALKFTPERGRVSVAARPHQGGAEITVADSGIGISKEDQARLFERFVRVGAPRREASGHGLGLSIVKEIVEQHGGRITVESEGLRRGTLFRVFLPGARVEATAPDADSAPGKRPRRVLLLMEDARSGGIETLRRALGESGDSLRIVSSRDRLGDEARDFRPHTILVSGTAEAAAEAEKTIRALPGNARARGIAVERVS
jgi:signal transduction histidine kinase